MREVGASAQLLIKLYQAGKLQRVARGIYSLPDAPVTKHQTFAEVCQRVPWAVICMLSALQFHGIGTQLPHEVWIALPEGTQTPAVTYPRLRVARLRGAAYAEGIQMVMDQGTPIRVYGAAKTITDCFKFRNKVGVDVALEALGSGTPACPGQVARRRLQPAATAPSASSWRCCRAARAARASASTSPGTRARSA